MLIARRGKKWSKRKEVERKSWNFQVAVTCLNCTRALLENLTSQRSHVLEGVEGRNEEIGGELDDLGEQDGDLISALEKQVEKTRRGRLRVQKSEDRKRKVEQRLMAAYQRMEASSGDRGSVKPIRFRSSPQDATKNKKQAAEDARKRREQEYSELLGVDAAQIGARRRSSGRILH
ncbi:hypothetical protein FOZ60_010005 [Perkinsus olseni]|uniref:Uncharacterized protein n=1 Tax=Perkinsus olseni TaxID=32597 RepID=A0A7J6NGC9_PEROL|nr:hypothetical protein FOZ60_010005 [Perkinsus olseni]